MPHLANFWCQSINEGKIRALDTQFELNHLRSENLTKITPPNACSRNYVCFEVLDGTLDT